MKGSYIETYPGIQRIVNSNTRIEFCYGFQLIGYSHVHFTPIWTIAVQRYFYNTAKRKKTLLNKLIISSFNRISSLLTFISCCKLFYPTFASVKRFIAIGLIFVMSAQCFYNLGVLTYFQLNRDFIAKVLCVNKEKPITLCHGQCFLKKNIDLSDQSTSNEDNVPASKNRIDFPVFLIIEHSYIFKRIVNRDITSSAYFTSCSSKHTSTPFHPPAVLS